MTIADIKKNIEASSVRAVIEAAYARAEHADNFHSLLSLTKERALSRADELDASGKLSGPLAGVPFIAKDNMLAFGSPTTAAAKILENFDAPFQAEVIERLENAGAICIGKANLDAFAHGGSTENSAYGPTKNPHDDTRVPGGSSGGSAAVVALGIVPFALGSDTGGSIRQPASFTGVVGYKPTYGTVSRYGVVAMASSTDVIGPLASTARDVQIVLEVIAGKDAKDATTHELFLSAPAKTAKKKVGIIKEWMTDGVDEDVRRAVETKISQLQTLGYEAQEVSLPSLTHALAVYYIVVPAEIASNLGRYDGIRYGNTVDAPSLSGVYEATRGAGFMDENKRRILIGNYVLSSGYYDAYFEKAAKVRTIIINEFNKAFSDYDFLIGPVAPTAAFKLGENTADPLKMYLADLMTVPASLAGLPAISVPAGDSKEGLPIGLQIIGPQKSDSQLLSFAALISGENKS